FETRKTSWRRGSGMHAMTAPKEPSHTLPHFDLEAFKEKNYLTHNLHPYPAKFVPQIPRLLLERFCRPGSVVLDPFCGSGTAVLEAVLNDCTAIGVDLHPLAVLITRAKTTSLDHS